MTLRPVSAGAAALALLVCASVAVAAQSSQGRTLTVTGSVGSISADGSRVAIHSAREDVGCDYGTLWNATTGAFASLRCGSTMSGVRYADLTLAGDTAIWWDYDTGNHVYCNDVFASPFTHPTTEHGLGICDGTEGDTYYEFAGDRTLVAIVDYSVCESDCVGANGDLLPDGDYGVEVRRLVGGKLRTILPPVDFRNVLDARNWRVATIEPKATLTVYDARGKLLWRKTGVRGVLRGRLAGNAVVVQVSGAVQVYAPGSAAPRTWSLPKGAYLEDAAGGLAVYSKGSSVHLLRLSDGRDRKLVTAKGFVQAQITPAGVFYAAGSSVTFVPIAAVLRKLS